MTDAALLRLVTAAGDSGSLAPELVARHLAETSGRDWHQHLAAVRNSAVRLARAGLIEITRKGRPIAPDAMKGVVRMRAVRAAGDR